MTDISDKLVRLKKAEAAYEADKMEYAISAFQALADEGIPQACQYLGLIYRTGDGVEKNDLAASQWYSKYVFLLQNQSRSGSNSAKYDLAKLYQYGEHVNKNEGKALKLFTELAEDGFRDAEFSLASFFKHGWCQCPINEKKYVFWLKKAAEHHHPEAMYYYGLMLVKEGDVKNGEKLLSESAGYGFWLAQDYFLNKKENCHTSNNQ